MPAQLQYTLQRSQPFSALSHPNPRSSNSSFLIKGKDTMFNNLTAPSRKPEYITRDYYAQAASPTSAWSTDGSSESDSDNEFCFDDIESSQPSSTFSARASTSSALTSPLLCTCNTSRKPSLTVGDFTFENKSDYSDYLELVRSQTRNVAKRRATSSTQQSLSYTSSSSQSFSSSDETRGRRRQRHLRKLEEQQEDVYQFEALPQANSVPELTDYRHVYGDYTSSFEPALLSAKLEALLVATPSYSPTFTETDSIPSLDLDSEGDEYQTDEETDIEEGHELVKVQAHAGLAPSPRKAPESESRFERALSFAKWNKRGRAGLWESPEGVSETVRDLVASIEAQ